MKKFLPVILILFVMFTGCSVSSPQVQNSIADKSITDVPEIYIMAGKVDVSEQVNVSSRIASRVSDITVDVGSVVKVGDPIILLDKHDLLAQVNHAQAAVGVAGANLNKALSGTRKEQIAQAQNTVDSMKKSYDYAKTNVEKVRELYQSAAVSKKELDVAETGFTSAQAQYNSALEQVKLLQSGETKETINVYRSQLDQAKAGLEVYKTQLDNAVITAPISGIVSVRNIQKGEMATIGQTLVTIVNDDNLLINAYAPPNLIDQIKVGQDVFAKVSEIPNKKFEGKIEVIDPVIDTKNRNVLVKISIKNSERILKPGMIAQIGVKQ